VACCQDRLLIVDGREGGRDAVNRNVKGEWGEESGVRGRERERGRGKRRK